MKYLQPRYVKVEAFMIVSDFSDHLGYRGLQDHKKNSKKEFNWNWQLHFCGYGHGTNTFLTRLFE